MTSKVSSDFTFSRACKLIKNGMRGDVSLECFPTFPRADVDTSVIFQVLVQVSVDQSTFYSQLSCIVTVFLC